jgi:hypothetical protein
VFEKRVLRKKFGPQEDDVTGEFKRLHNEKLRVLYSSPDNIWMVKSINMKEEGRVGRMKDKSGA